MITLFVLIVNIFIAVIVTVLMLITGAGVLCLLPILSDAVILIAVIKTLKKNKKGGDKH